jgi:hypothetical protein
VAGRRARVTHSFEDVVLAGTTLVPEQEMSIGMNLHWFHVACRRLAFVWSLRIIHASRQSRRCPVLLLLPSSDAALILTARNALKFGSLEAGTVTTRHSDSPDSASSSKPPFIRSHIEKRKIRILPGSRAACPEIFDGCWQGHTD